MLIDRTGRYTVGTTDPVRHLIFLSLDLQGEFLTKVLLHELSHAVMISYNLIETIHNMVYPDKWIEAEEWVCNFMADYGYIIFSIANLIVGPEGWKYVPYELEKLVQVYGG